MIIKKNISLTSEILILIGLGIAFLLVSIFLGPRLQPVWIDEVVLAEPAANLALYDSFTSAAWYHQNDQEFHVSTSFLYTVLLALWIKVLGFSIEKVRLFNYVLMLLSITVIWLFIKKLPLIRFSWLRIILVVSCLLPTGITFIYISGRYDTSCIFLSALVLVAFLIKDAKIRWLTMTIIGFFFPLSGLSAVVFATIFGGILLLFNFQRFWREFVALGGGFILGMLFLYALYSTNGVWDDFVSMTLGHSVANANLNRTVIDIIFSRVSKLFDQKDYVCGGCLHPSFPPLSLLLLILIFYELLTKSFRWRSPSFFALITVITIPTTMCFLGKYPLYYSWMSMFPLIICICWSFNNILEKNTGKIQTTIISIAFLVLLLYANLLGLPSLAQITLQQWENNDYTKVQNFLDNKINPQDHIYADFQTFYALKSRAKRVYFPLYNGQMTPEDRDNLSLIVIDPRASVRASWNPGLAEIVGDSLPQWYDTGEQLDTGTYGMKLYRKR
ncbi:MAG: glycosyltransferase family 39 protein [Microcystis aeruginosa L111-01]|nr:glycosyltransferase family 39 protein [Microcystis aeruginosa L111-01]NCS15588.1 glycosyltransferase family 39 protein [Microcystis aeruginosa G13-12]NCT51825.1 glycosyltransferase family 39 protein [Microcystis aeruginosa G13-03]